MGQGSTENHSRTAKRPVLIPPRRAHLRCPPLCPPPVCGWRVTRIPGACASPSFRGGHYRPGPGAPISAGAATPGAGPLPLSAFRFLVRPAPPIPFSVTLSSRSIRTFGPISPFRARRSRRVPPLRFRPAFGVPRIGSFLFEHWWGIIKITIQASVLEGGKREKFFIGNGFMILFSSFPRRRAP